MLVFVLLLQLVKLPCPMDLYLIPEDADPALRLDFVRHGQSELPLQPFYLGVGRKGQRRRLDIIDDPLVQFIQYFGRCGLSNQAQPVNIGIALASSVSCRAH